MKIKKLLQRLYKDESGALNDFIGLIIFLIVIFMMLVPLVVELMVYTGQTQEVDRLTKIAAKRACSMTAAPEQRSTVGGDLNMGSVGAGINILALPIIVDSVRREAAHPEQYSRFELTLYDATGQVVEAEENFTMETPSGNSAQIALAGANGEGSLCPSGGGNRWDYCRDPGSDEAIKRQVRNTGGTENRDLIQRMERFQAGRCRQGETTCGGDFVGRIDRCTVCASKRRQSIFGRGFDDGTGFFGILSCRTEADRRVLPCKIQACASEKLTQVGGTRGYNRAYLDAKNFGSIGRQAGGGNAGGGGARYTAAEIHYGEAQNQNNTLSTGETSTKWHTDEWDDSYKPHGSTPQAGGGGQQQTPDPTDLKATNNGFGTLDEQYGAIKTH